MLGSDMNPRIVDVSGTTWTTLGCASSVRSAVTITAGCVNPASRPTGCPNSTSTMSPARNGSPEIGIEPGDLVVAERSGQLLTHPRLAQRTHRQRDRVTNRGIESSSKVLEVAMGSQADPHARALHAQQHMPDLAAGGGLQNNEFRATLLILTLRRGYLFEACRHRGHDDEETMVHGASGVGSDETGPLQGG